jgi:hypothetical protein
MLQSTPSKGIFKTTTLLRPWNDYNHLVYKRWHSHCSQVTVAIESSFSSICSNLISIEGMYAPSSMGSYLTQLPIPWKLLCPSRDANLACNLKPSTL